jgi:hypothetical protein
MTEYKEEEKINYKFQSICLFENLKGVSITMQDLAAVVPNLDSAGVDLLSVSVHLIYLLQCTSQGGKTIILGVAICVCALGSGRFKAWVDKNI